MALKALTAVVILFGLGLASLDGVRCSPLQTKTCGKGQKLEDGRCQNCEMNTFNDKVAHSLDFCKPCTKYHLEFNENYCNVTIINCTRDTDTVILCGNGCYLGYSRDECWPCSNCTHKANKHIGRECQANDDTICCPKLNMTVVLEQNYFKCISNYSIENATDFTTSQKDMTTDSPQTSVKNNVTDSVMHGDSGISWLHIFVPAICVIIFILIILVLYFRVQICNIVKRKFCKAKFLPVPQSDNENNNL